MEYESKLLTQLKGYGAVTVAIGQNVSEKWRMPIINLISIMD